MFWFVVSVYNIEFFCEVMVSTIGHHKAEVFLNGAQLERGTKLQVPAVHGHYDLQRWRLHGGPSPQNHSCDKSDDSDGSTEENVEHQERQL